MADCIFCKIIEGSVPSDIVYKNDEVVAFRDVNPQAPVHVLVVPRRHISSLLDVEAVDGDMLEAVFSAARQIALSLGLEDGFRVVANCGKKGGQTVDHIHFHLLGKRQMTWPPG